MTSFAIAPTNAMTLLAANVATNIAPSATKVPLFFSTNEKILNSTNPKPTMALRLLLKAATSLSPFSSTNFCTAGITFVIKI